MLTVAALSTISVPGAATIISVVPKMMVPISKGGAVIRRGARVPSHKRSRYQQQGSAGYCDGTGRLKRLALSRLESIEQTLYITIGS